LAWHQGEADRQARAVRDEIAGLIGRAKARIGTNALAG
jgi:hypothetical protein